MASRYYHCTQCPAPYTREEVLEQKFTELIAEITFRGEMLEQVQQALGDGAAHEQAQCEATVARLQREHRRLEERIEAMYVDKLDGVVDRGLFDRKAAEWRAQQAEIAQQIEEHRSAHTAQIVDVRHLAQRAVELFAQQPPHEKRKLLNYVISGCSSKDGELTPQWRKPWDEITRVEAMERLAA